MLRSAGFVIGSNPEEEVYVCRPAPVQAGFGAVYPASPPRRLKEVAA
jgi:tRNA (mo5U34)-methyltransferase